MPSWVYTITSVGFSHCQMHSLMALDQCVLKITSLQLIELHQRRKQSKTSIKSSSVPKIITHLNTANYISIFSKCKSINLPFYSVNVSSVSFCPPSVMSAVAFQLFQCTRNQNSNEVHFYLALSIFPSFISKAIQNFSSSLKTKLR